MDSPSATIPRPARDVPVAFRTQVLVCGGGPAGTAAAIAAARQGAKVTLLERYNHLGGLATGGLVLVLPHFRDHGRPTIGGIGREIREALAATGEAAFRHLPHDDSCTFDPEALKWQSVKLCHEAGVQVLHHCWLSDVVTSPQSTPWKGVGDEARRITGVIFESKAGTRAVLADVVVDCTGDGDIFAWAGCEFEKSDQAIGLPFRVGGVDVDAWMAWVEKHPDDSREVWDSLTDAIGWPDSMFYISPLYLQAGVLWGNNYYRVADGLDPAALSEVDIGARLRIRQALDILRQRLPGWEGAWLIDTASQLGVRRSRRLVGLQRLTEAETGTPDYRHPDAIGRGNDFRKADSAYDIPYGCLVPREVDGLLTAGRCISCSDEALEPIREIHVCWVTGEAAGTAAALAVQAGVSPREVAVGALQQRLGAAGVAFAD
ncbi:MAG: FAD-dependent oxidoreductase [Armatimonadetes bacterium]|nr:FAD-dependent oxidoreductase [Armatimonadota bacterium]